MMKLKGVNIDVKRRMAALLVCAAMSLGITCSAAMTCGAVNYDQHADALAEAHDWLCTVAAYVYIIICTLGTCFAIYSGLQIYIKMQIEGQGVLKDIVMTFGAILFLVGAFIYFPSLFGYRYAGPPIPIN